MSKSRPRPRIEPLKDLDFSDLLYFELNFRGKTDGGADRVEDFQLSGDLAESLVLNRKTMGMLNVVRGNINKSLNGEAEHEWLRLAHYPRDPNVVVWVTKALFEWSYELIKRENNPESVTSWLIQNLQRLSKDQIDIVSRNLGTPESAPKSK